MADILLDEQGTPASPGLSQGVIFADSSSSRLSYRDDSARVHTFSGAIRNWNTADVTANAVDTYLSGSALALPQHLLQVGTTFKWRMFVTKTGAGIAAPIWRVRVGTLGTTGDAAVLTFTGAAQTGVIDTAFIEITAILRNTGAAGILAGGLVLNHNLAATGFANIGSPTLQVTSAGFNTTTANLIVGVSVDPGSLGVWTHQVVKGEMLNI